MVFFLQFQKKKKTKKKLETPVQRLLEILKSAIIKLKNKKLKPKPIIKKPKNLFLEHNKRKEPNKSVSWLDVNSDMDNRY